MLGDKEGEESNGCLEVGVMITDSSKCSGKLVGWNVSRSDFLALFPSSCNLQKIDEPGVKNGEKTSNVKPYRHPRYQEIFQGRQKD